MNSFKKKRFSLVIICVLTATYSFGQIKVSEFIQYSKIASSTNNKLIFVDFWATWCGPCITAKEHLGVLQKQFPTDFYVVSLSKENPLIVERFLKKRPTDLAVAIDYNGETFSDYNVRALPEGVLLNANGKILWQGGTPDLKKDMVSKFLRQQTAKSTLDSFFNEVSISEEKSIDYSPSEAIEITSLNHNIEELKVVNNKGYLKLSGSLKNIISYLTKIYKNQIVLDKSLNTTYEVYFKKPLTTNENLAYKLIMEMGFDVERKYSKGEGISFAIDNPKFWDTNQIDWGRNNAKYLVGDSQIKADNVSLKDVAYQLAQVLDIPVVIVDETEVSSSLHDWDFHYKFFQLMQTDLEDNYGIKAEKKTIAFPVYHIQKKAP